jgi:hypothetical protein
MKKGKRNFWRSLLFDWLDLPSILLFSSYLTGPGGDNDDTTDTSILDEMLKHLGAAHFCLNNQLLDKAKHELEQADLLAPKLDTHTTRAERVLTFKTRLWEEHSQAIRHSAD